MKVRSVLSLYALVVALFTGTASMQAGEFASKWHNALDRIWVGEDFWANPMEDWRVRDGRLECIRRGANRNVHSLIAQLGKKDGSFELRVRMGLDDPGKGGGTAGFRIGIQTEFDDYLHRVFKGSGLNAGITTSGDLFIGEPVPKPTGRGIQREQLNDLELILIGQHTPKVTH